MNKTKLIKFTYTKDTGETSDRVGITIGYSSPKLALIVDVTSIDDLKSCFELTQELDRIRKEYLMEVSEILSEWDYAATQKTFKLSGITNETELTP
jgi:hypothetical protein